MKAATAVVVCTALVCSTFMGIIFESPMMFIVTMGVTLILFFPVLMED